MRYLLSLALTMSFFVIAQEDETSYKYEPPVNKAEYYIGKFNKGKDVNDLAEWYGKFAKWAEGKDGVYDKMTVAILQPYFHSDMGSAYRRYRSVRHCPNDSGHYSCAAQRSLTIHRYSRCFGRTGRTCNA